MNRPIHLDPEQYRAEQRRQHREDKAKRRAEHEAYVAKVDAERQTDNERDRPEAHHRPPSTEVPRHGRHGRVVRSA